MRGDAWRGRVALTDKEVLSAFLVDRKPESCFDLDGALKPIEELLSRLRRRWAGDVVKDCIDLSNSASTVLKTRLPHAFHDLCFVLAPTPARHQA